MNAYVMDAADVSYMDEMLLDESGRVRVLPCSEYKNIPADHIKMWGNKNGVYCLPTVELIEWLRDRIGGRKAVEICAGNGAIGRALGIVTTDSHIQTMPEMAAYYKSIGQKPISPPSDVYEFEANEAIDTLKPKVVVASYATQKYEPGDEREPKIGSSVYGVDEIFLLQKVETYIFVGNDASHGDKRINAIAHETIRPDWLVTRAMEPSKNFIKVW